MAGTLLVLWSNTVHSSRSKGCPPGGLRSLRSLRPLPLSPASPPQRELVSNGPLPLPLCGGAQAPWRASSLRLRLRSELSDGFSLPFRLKRVFALVSTILFSLPPVHSCFFLLKIPVFAPVSATFLYMGFCSCPVFYALSDQFFENKEKPAPSRLCSWRQEK